MSLKTLFIAILLIFLICSLSFAGHATPNFSGQDYLDLSRSQRADAIASFIEASKLRDVTIRNNETFYRDKLDIFYAEHPDFIDEALFVVLKTLVVMEYDWDQKGLDKDFLARKWLGEELYHTNNLRLEMRQEAL